MNQKGKFRIGFIDELQAQILEMKYAMGKLSMLVLLPSCSEDNVNSLQEVKLQILLCLYKFQTTEEQQSCPSSKKDAVLANRDIGEHMEPEWD